MIYNHNYRKAAAYAGAGASESDFSSKNGMLFSQNSETDDFNQFTNSRGPRRAPRQAPKRPKKPNDTVYEIDFKTLMIALGALAALILIIVIIVAAVNSKGKDVVKENNTYATYEKDGAYYVAVNGDTIDESFENKVELVTAKDNSFAYLIEKSPDGDIVYILEKKKLIEAVPSPVTKVLALAELTPGIVYRDGNNVNFYRDDDSDCITRNDATADNFIIAHDASAVAYTTANKDNVDETKLFIYADGVRESYATNMYPVEISKGGKYLYAYGVSSDDFTTKKLYLIKTLDDEKINIASGFDSILDSNIKGDEIVYTVGSFNAGYQSWIFNAKKEKAYKVGGGKCEPIMTENVVKLSTFKNSVLENVFFVDGADPSNSATYVVNKKYASTKVSSYNGKLNSDGDMFYYIDNDETLYYIDLNKKRHEPVEIYLGATEFVITEKDNIYFIDSSDYLWFYKASGGNKKQIETQVSAISFNPYSNILYFEITDDSKIYSTEEGSGKDIVEFSKTEISSIPVFIDQGLKRTFTSVFNEESGLYDLYYTSTGKTFKLIEEGCDYIK